ncbi:MAG: hypothetical protein WC492_01910 [Candidatus Micrarchaeia archaeon]
MLSNSKFVLLSAMFLLFFAGVLYSESCALLPSGSLRCNPSIPYQVDKCTLGEWTPLQSCVYGCSNGVCGECANDLKRCNDAKPYQVDLCVSNKWTPLQSCAYGCSNGACVECTNNEKRCNDAKPYQVDICTAGVWEPFQSCANGCSNGECIPNTVLCTNNEKRCNDVKPYQVDICTMGVWEPFQSCVYGCSNGECAVSSNSCSNVNDLRCNPTNTNQVDTCTRDPADPMGTKLIWTKLKDCPSDNVCSAGTCVSQNYGSCSKLNALRCSSSISGQIDICTRDPADPMGKLVWMRHDNCGTGFDCKQNNDVVTCVASGSGNSGGSSGGSGSGLTSSGGGEVPRCTSWSEWYVNATNEKTEASGGKTRVCINTTYTKWCIKSSGQFDTTRSEKKYDYKCAAWNEQCDYAYEKTESYSQNSGGQCRTCKKEIFVYVCKPSGTKDYSLTKESLNCGAYRECTASEISNLSGTQTKPTAQKSELDTLVEQYGLVLGLLLAALIVIVLITGWKMFKAKEE